MASVHVCMYSESSGDLRLKKNLYQMERKIFNLHNFYNYLNSPPIHIADTPLCMCHQNANCCILFLQPEFGVDNTQNLPAPQPVSSNESPPSLGNRPYLDQIFCRIFCRFNVFNSPFKVNTLYGVARPLPTTTTNMISKCMHDVAKLNIL